MSDVRGRFLWHELYTSDVEAAVAFYKAVIGWGTEIWDGAGEPYTMWMSSEGPVGGVMVLPEAAAAAGAPPHWLAYAGVPDLDASLSAAGERGASLLWGPVEVPGIGRMAGLQDPQGAVIAVYQPESVPEAMAMGPGQISWHELATEDWKTAWSFYSDLFGWETTEAMDMGGGNIYHMYGRPGGPTLGGMYTRSPEMPVSAWLLYATVPDIDAAVEAVKAGGGQLLNGPMEVPGGDRVAQCTDPQGAAFALHAPVAG